MNIEYLSLSFLVRLYIQMNGVYEEIGNGYNVGPGHGLIVSKVGDDIRVNLYSISHENYFSSPKSIPFYT